MTDALYPPLRRPGRAAPLDRPRTAADAGFLFREGRIAVRPTIPRDLDFVVGAERAPENARFIIPWTPEQHAAAMVDPAFAHWVVVEPSSRRRLGYLILTGLGGVRPDVELRRLVVVDKGRGYGAEALALVQRAVFEQLGAHRLWLDVMVHNARARRLYRSAGFVEEGTLRECLRTPDGCLSLVVMARLAREYAAARATANGAVPAEPTLAGEVAP